MPQPLNQSGPTQSDKPNITFDADEQKFISNTPVKWYAFVIDGEVVWMQTVSVLLEYLVAVMSSNPQVVEIPEPIMGQVLNGWTYNGITFQPPAGAE